MGRICGRMEGIPPHTFQHTNVDDLLAPYCRALALANNEVACGMVACKVQHHKYLHNPWCKHDVHNDLSTFHGMTGMVPRTFFLGFSPSIFCLQNQDDLLDSSHLMERYCICYDHKLFHIAWSTVDIFWSTK